MGFPPAPLVKRLPPGNLRGAGGNRLVRELPREDYSLPMQLMHDHTPF